MSKKRNVNWIRSCVKYELFSSEVSLPVGTTGNLGGIKFFFVMRSLAYGY